MTIYRTVLFTAVRPFSTKKKRANRKNPLSIRSYDALFMYVPATEK